MCTCTHIHVRVYVYIYIYIDIYISSLDSITVACAIDASLSPKTDENSGEVMISTDLRPKCKDSKLRFSISEKPDIRGGVGPLSMLSANEGNVLSILGLPELTNDMSVSGDESSYGFPLGPFL